MGSKRKAFVHIGLDDGSGDFVDAALELHQRALAELGVRRPATSSEEMFRAALEMLRTHRDWGYTRDEVEGAWTTIVNRGQKGKDTLVFSQALLAAARPEQAALLVDALSGFEVHVVVTVRAPDAWTLPGEPGHDLGAVLATWGAAVKKPQRVHVIVSENPRPTWKSLGKVVGFGTSSLTIDRSPSATRTRPPHLTPAARLDVLRALGTSWVDLLAHSEYDVVGDPALLVPSADAAITPEVLAGMAEHALRDALAEIERLGHRNASLEARLEKVEKKRKKLKRKLAAVA
ncbi:hypothetical protein [Nocardioides sp.]|uniref:hypothetical protein n=1 Tax=Nocardioides sp. TaxID=35761 RepID=UPI002B278EB9|nr:hypothetical protein [Nocardioides sp.]